MSGNPPIPTTTKGYKIFPRTYIIWTRANKAQLLQHMKEWVDNLNETSEYLAEWKPSAQVQGLQEIPNNYYVILENVSSKMIRDSFLKMLIDLKKNIILPKEGRLAQTPYKSDVFLNLTLD